MCLDDFGFELFFHSTVPYQEMHAVAGLAYLFRGLTAFNMGAEILTDVYQEAATPE